MQLHFDAAVPGCICGDHFRSRLCQLLTGLLQRAAVPDPEAWVLGCSPAAPETSAVRWDLEKLADLADRTRTDNHMS